MDVSSAPSARAELARAKVNLTLHITGQRPDGYHLLESLAAFPQIGDRLAVAAAEKLELVVEGPFARGLDGPPDGNLVLKAATAFSNAAGIPVPKVRFTLTKRLPVASGIGGGSSDAATALRLLEDFTGTYLAEKDLHELALSIGADVPVCLFPEPQLMRGVGEDLEPGPILPKCGIVLVNPKTGVSTPDVFRALEVRDNPPMPALPEKFDDLPRLASVLSECRNDLQEPAIGLCGTIDDVLSALKEDARIAFARMSGSGATCFGLCEMKDALDVERSLRTAHPDWWIASGPLT